MEVGQSSKSKKVTEVVLNLEKKVDGRGFCLVGKIFTHKNLNVPTVVNMIRKGWQLGESVEIHDLNRNQLIFLFRFSKEEDYAHILKGRPWSIQGFLLNLQAWDDAMVLKDINFEYEPFWVQFHGLPLAAFDSENARILGDAVGKSVMFEKPMVEGKLGRDFIRVRSLIKLDKPLLDGFWVPREGKDPAWVTVKFERLQILCYRCGCIGHEGQGCKAAEGESDGVETEFKYGSWLSTPSVRTCEDALEVCKGDWMEANFFKKKSPAAPPRRSNSSEGIKSPFGNLAPRQEECQVQSCAKLVIEDLHWEKVEQKCLPSEISPAARSAQNVQNIQVTGSEGKLYKSANFIVVPLKDLVNSLGEGALSSPAASFHSSTGPARSVRLSELNSGSPPFSSTTQEYQVEFPAESEPNNSGIIPFNGLSPISDMANSLKRIQLKRPLEDSSGMIESKRHRRLSFDDSGLSPPVSSSKALAQKWRRKSIRTLKQHIRNSRSGESFGSGGGSQGIGEIDFPPSWVLARHTEDVSCEFL